MHPMRDPLLERENDHLAASRRARDAAREEARALGERAEVISEIGKWSRRALFGTGILAGRSEDHDLSDLLTLPPEQSPLQAFQLVRDAGRRQSLQEGFAALLEARAHERTDVAAWLFGCALASALVEELDTPNTPSEHLLAGVWNLVRSRELIYQAFGETLPQLLQKAPPARHAALAELRERFDEIKDNPGIGAYSREREAFTESVDTWRLNRSLVALWKAREHGELVRYDVLGLVPMILPAGRSRVLAILDGFDFPHPIRQVFGYGTILHDRDEIVACIEKAPSCSSDNRSWNHSLPAFLLLETAERHCRDLWQAACRATHPDEVESVAVERTSAKLSAWFETLGRAVMARPDGEFLGSWWLLLKTIDERTERARGAGSGDRRREHLRQEDLIEWIALGLSKAGLSAAAVAALADLPGRPDPGDISPAPPAPNEAWQASVRLGALSVMTVLDHMIGDASPDDVSPQIERLRTLLALRDPSFEAEAHLISSSVGLPANSAGVLFARTRQPAAEWQRCWGLVVEQRRRAQHWRETKDGDAMAPALFLLAAGTAGIDWLMSPGLYRRDEARDLWRAVFDGARDCWLTISLQHLVERAETHVARLFARHPMVFGEPELRGDSSEPATESGIEDYGELLARDLAFLGGNDLVVAICCLNAYRNGATPAVMNRVLHANASRIDTQLRQFERWQRYERQVLRRTDIVAELAGLRNEIERLG